MPQSLGIIYWGKIGSDFLLKTVMRISSLAGKEGDETSFSTSCKMNEKRKMREISLMKNILVTFFMRGC